MRYIIIFLILIVFLENSYSQAMKDGDLGNKSIIDPNFVEKVIKDLKMKYGGGKINQRIEKGVRQVANFWTMKDGPIREFEDFCNKNFITKEDELEKVFQRISTNSEVLNGHFNKMGLDLSRPIQLDAGEILPIDMMFGAYNPAANLSEDFYKNKIAFYVLLNFPFYNLKEKEILAPKWSRKDWAYARVGDLFISRVPGELYQKISEAYTNADTYISEYNIFMGNLTDGSKKSFFPKDMKLISHWNLRDELKSQYGNEKDGLDKQKMIYEVMKKIISQEIPSCVINNDNYTWNPYNNKVFQNNEEFECKSEPNTRYQHLLNNFLVKKEEDQYYPQYPTYISRKFDLEFEIPQPEVEKLFSDLCSSPTVKKVGKLISERLGRKLQPFDIWYDGFKARSTMKDEDLTKMTQTKYPNTEAFAKDMPRILKQLGFEDSKANQIASLIEVDASRGPGHAAGADMKSEKAHLRTRVVKDGMNYKGYNIAVHEFGHNVEQTLTLQDVDYYMLRSVPNTAFTEAWAFVFQNRDLELLGIKDDNPDKKHLRAIDNFWMAYEIMGVSLVDMNVWKWLYAHPDANAAQLKDAVLDISKDIWNKYFAEVFGIKDQTILAIYSHMIDNPLYLSAYPIGHLIEFQMEKAMEGKNLGTEMQRILTRGRLIPQVWMQGAVGNNISIQPTIEATEEALKSIK